MFVYVCCTSHSTNVTNQWLYIEIVTTKHTTQKAVRTEKNEIELCYFLIEKLKQKTHTKLSGRWGLFSLLHYNEKRKIYYTNLDCRMHKLQHTIPIWRGVLSNWYKVFRIDGTDSLNKWQLYSVSNITSHLYRPQLPKRRNCIYMIYIFIWFVFSRWKKHGKNKNFPFFLKRIGIHCAQEILLGFFIVKTKPKNGLSRNVNNPIHSQLIDYVVCNASSSKRLENTKASLVVIRKCVI